MKLLGSLMAFCYVLGRIQGQRTAAEWKTRTIYHLLTDRFSPDGETPTEPCTALRSWCGGNFKGIQQRLDYIKNLGANAIWISPIVLNTPGGYHGYWASNIYEIEPHWGTREDLKDLIAAAHEKDIWVMVDVVPNHMGYPPNCGEFQCQPGAELDFSAFVPFNQSEHFHEICHPVDWNNLTQVEECRLANLPDLNQTVPYVRQTLLDWIRDLTAEFGIDGYRVDTVKHIAMDFWPEWQEASGAFCLGEVWIEDSVAKVAQYQTQGQMDSVFNFPLVGALKGVWHHGASMRRLDDILKESRQLYRDTHVLGVFVDNHDVERFLNLTSDLAQFRNALTMVSFWEGIPLIYYGSEQAFHGGRDPDCRESLWPHYNEDSDMYKFIKEGLDFRGATLDSIIDSPQTNLHVDDESLIFTRAANQILVAITKAGPGQVRLEKEFSFNVRDGTVYSNIRDSSDVITVDNGRLKVVYTNGEPKVYRKGPEPSSASTLVSSVSLMALLLILNSLH